MSYPWTAHDILTASDLNAAISTGIVKTGLTAPTNYTPVVVQSNTPTLTVDYAAWQKVGRWVTVMLGVVITSAGTANNAITCTFPSAAGTLVPFRILGTGAVFDTSAGFWYSGVVRYITATTFDIVPNGATPLGSTGSTMTAALANGDRVSAVFNFWTSS